MTGSTWREPLLIRSSGTRSAPFTVMAYGAGARPRIDAGDVATNAVEIVNVEHVRLSGLEITNHGVGVAERRGVLIAADNVGTLHDIMVTDLYIHDVNGTNEHKETGGILFRTTATTRPSRFDGLAIERNILWKVDRSAIVGKSDQLDRAKWFPSLGVIIRDNFVEDIGGDGIVPWATDGVLVEHNIVRRAVQRAPGYNAGIWQWSTDNSLFQLNEASLTRGTLDGQGFDSDYNSRGTTFLYNYSHDNDGGFMLICTPVKREEAENIGNRGTVIWRNISRHDRARVFNLSGADDVLVAENAIYTAPGDDVQMLLVSNWDGWSNGATFRDNLFDVAGRARYGHEVGRDLMTGLYLIAPGWGPARAISFVGNRYIGDHVDRPIDTGQSRGFAPVSYQTDAWTPPRFDPARPVDYPDYIRRHRAWMLELMRRQFGKPIRLATPKTFERFDNPGSRLEQNNKELH